MGIHLVAGRPDLEAKRPLKNCAIAQIAHDEPTWWRRDDRQRGREKYPFGHGTLRFDGYVDDLDVMAVRQISLAKSREVFDGIP
ncbi:MAG: hypothetical protein WCK95_19395 [Alphaproteobacteria bacterium]